ncbi:PAS domain S-box protein [Pseudodesulfovibrio sp.]|uniref:PAS domain S-box protein n=1 Tax=Pseudodesulfovibrio sp. TaxID=2035812 RepID=UPI002637AB89|nr:PAS domain S-box protein [Pseudodesulfovibrio sp.]MDD3310577.1 PAS domain S-box protein [Pseudodesulfovibrio sp.]
MKSLQSMSREELVSELEMYRERVGECDGRYELAIEASNDGVWEWDVRTDEARYSPRNFTMIGHAPEEFEPRAEAWKSLIHPDDLERALDMVRAHLERGEPFNIKYRVRDGKGEWRWILSRGRIVERDAEEKPVRLVGTHVDIHEQVLLSERLRTRNEELTVLNHLGRAVAASLSMEATVDAALDNLRRIVECDLVQLFTLEGESIVNMGLRSSIPLAPAFHEMRSDLGESLCGLAVKTRSPVFSRERDADRSYLRSEWREAGIRSHAAIPLVAGEEVLGVIGVGSREDREYAESESFLCSVASVVATGLANARLHQRVRRHSEELEAQVEERTRELAKLSNAIERASISIMITDVNGAIEYVNPYFSNLTGYLRGEVLGRNPRILKSGRHGVNFYRGMWQRLLRGKIWRGEICNRRKDGSEYWERASISPLLDAEGNPTHFVAVTEDVTQRRKREQELLVLSKAIKNASSSVIVTDKDGDIIYVNPSFTQLTGYSYEDAVGRNPRILKSGLHEPVFYAELWKTIAGGMSWSGEILNRRKDGTRFWMAARISPVYDRHGEITHYVGVQNDITEKKELEQLKGDVDRIMRHDLKTPLNAIIGFPVLIEMEGNLTEDQLELTRAITRAARKMLRLIDLSLDFFKMETGQYEYYPRRVDLAACLLELMVEFQSKLSAKRQRLIVTFDGEPVREDQTYWIQSEDSLIYSLLSNLLSNAIEASPPGGDISVKVDCADGCHISIRNTGVVPPPIRKSFFQKYKTYGKKSGTGLGTYSAKMLADAMGYSVRMETSDAENATVLHVVIPSDSCVGPEK